MTGVQAFLLVGTILIIAALLWSAYNLGQIAQLRKVRNRRLKR